MSRGPYLRPSELSVLKDCAQACCSLPPPFALGYILTSYQFRGSGSSRDREGWVPLVTTWWAEALCQHRLGSSLFATPVPWSCWLWREGLPGSCPLTSSCPSTHTLDISSMAPSSGPTPAVYQWCRPPSSEHWDLALRVEGRMACHTPQPELQLMLSRICLFF